MNNKNAKIERFLENQTPEGLKQICRFLLNDTPQDENLGFVLLAIEEYSRMYPELNREVVEENV